MEYCILFVKRMPAYDFSESKGSKEVCLYVTSGLLYADPLLSGFIFGNLFYQAFFMENLFYQAFFMGTSSIRLFLWKTDLRGAVKGKCVIACVGLRLVRNLLTKLPLPTRTTTT